MDLSAMAHPLFPSVFGAEVAGWRNAATRFPSLEQSCIPLKIAILQISEVSQCEVLLLLPRLAFIFFACGCHHGQNMAGTNGHSSMKGPAPALRAVHITHVSSADDPQGEDADDNTITTTKTYAGDWLDVRTTEDGYGKNEHGKLGSADGKLKSKDGIVDSSGNVVGWKLVWEFTKPWSGGRFVFTADSANGGKEKSTYLIIKGGSKESPQNR